jgi:hypothetical protein
MIASEVLDFRAAEETAESRVGDPMTNTRFASIVSEINRRARKHRGGRLQCYRKELKGLKRRPGTELFPRATCFDEGYAFHFGGRRELQFNVGLECNNNKLRNGIAFSQIAMNRIRRW